MLSSFRRISYSLQQNILFKRSFSSYWQSLIQNQEWSTENGIIGEKLCNENNPTEALKYFEKCNDSNEQNSVLYAMMAQCYSNLNDHSNAIKYYEQHLGQHPCDEHNISNLAMQYHLIGDTDKANDLYINALSSNQNNGDLNFYYAHFLMHCQQNYELSLQYAQDAIKCDNISPPFSSIYVLMAQLYGMMNDLDTSNKYFDIAINQIGDDNANAYFGYAQILNACQKHKECINYLNDCLECLDESNPHHPAKNDIFMLLSSSYTELKDYKNAIKCTKQIVCEDIDIYGNLSLLYEYMNGTGQNPKEHELFYTNDLLQHPNDYYSNLFYAKYLIATERAIEALPYLYKAKSIDSDHYIVWYYNGLALYFGDRLNAYNEIIDCFEKVLKMEPMEINCYIYLCSLYAERGEYEQAFDVLKQGIAVDSECNLLYFNHAIIALCLNDIETYQDSMKKTIEICKAFSNEKSGKINAQLFYVKDGIYNLNNIINSKIEVSKEFGDYYFEDGVYKKAVLCYLQCLDEINDAKDYAFECYVFECIANCYLQIKGEQINMKRYCLMGLNKYPQSAQLNFLYSQFLFQFAESYLLAIKYLDITLKLEPENLSLYLIKANIFHNRLYDNPKAIECVNKVLELTDKNDALHAQARECLYQFTTLTIVK